MSNTTLTNAPVRTFDRLDQFMEEMFGGQFGFTPWTHKMGWNPAVDIKETEKEYTFVAELPGFASNDVNVELSNDILTISGKREKFSDEKSENFVRRERFFGEF